MNLDRWLSLMEAWGFSENRTTFDALVSAYSDSGRHYHSTGHISACLRHLDTCRHQLDFPREVELALWFHDAIYKPLSGSNEKDSADWAASFLEENGASQDDTGRVHRLVMATRHTGLPETGDEAALVDIDLSILGAAPEIYADFENAVREEYRMVPWDLYRQKRSEVLRGFLERPAIYVSGCLPEAMEARARENLRGAIARLECPG
jgi:predicted metal-dependent HD superfamily phosphohydrolase